MFSVIARLAVAVLMVLVATIALLSFVGRPQESADSSLANGPGGTTLQEEVRALHQRITTLQDDSRALFQRACEGDDTNGCYNLGLMIYNGRGGAIGSVGARDAYSRACEGDNADGCHNLGVMLSQGIGGPRDAAEANTAFQRACSLGDELSC